MQANSLNQILMNGMTAPVKGQVATSNALPQGKNGMVNEFAAILGQKQMMSQAMPKASLLQLLTQKFNGAEKLLQNPLMQKNTQALFGGVEEAALDKLPVGQLMTTANPVGQVLRQLQAVIMQDPALVQAAKADPQTASLLKLQVTPSLENNGLSSQVVFDPKASLADIKSAFVSPIQQQVNPVLNMAQERVLPQLKGNMPSASSLQSAEPMLNERKVVAPRPNMMGQMKQYAEGQAQFQSNIVKMPEREMGQVKNDLDSKKKQDTHNVLQMMGHQNKTLAGMTGAATAHQVIDLSHVEASNPSELIEKITTYIQQNALQRTDGLDLTVKHNELGQFRISVSHQVGAEQIHLQILANSKVGHDFFKAHENAIVKTLSEAGIVVGEMQVLAGMPNRTFAEGQQMNDGRQQQFSSHQDQNDFNQGDRQQRDSQRRRELWDEYRQRYSA